MLPQRINIDEVRAKSFERKHGINMLALAGEFFARSPHRNKLDAPNG